MSPEATTNQFNICLGSGYVVEEAWERESHVIRGWDDVDGR